MDPFAAAAQPLLVQYGIHLRRQRHLPSLRLAPGGAKCLCSRAAAEEARAMPGGERHRFVEKEKLGPAAAAHHLPVPPLVSREHKRATPWSIQRLPSNVLVAGSWMIPRLPMKRPRCAIATTSPNGVTRFCRGLRPLRINLYRYREGCGARRSPIRHPESGV